MLNDQNSVNVWSGNPSPASCGNNSLQTSTGDNTKWANMSIVVGSYGTQLPSFNYPSTAMSAWLCGAVVSGLYNNSAAEGQLFYEKFTGQSQAGGSLTVNGVTCPTREDVENGSVTNINGTY